MAARQTKSRKAKASKTSTPRNTKSNTTKNKTSSRSTSKQKDKKERQTPYRLIGILLIIIALYSAYSYAVAVPNAFDKIWGKGVLTYLFGNMTTIVCIYALVCGVMMVLKKWEANRRFMLYLALILLNLAIFFSINYPQMGAVALMDLFSPVIYCGGGMTSYGGVIGLVLAFILCTILTKPITIVLLVALTLLEIYLMISSRFPGVFDWIGTQGKEIVEKGAKTIKEDRELSQKRKEAEHKREAANREIIDQNYDQLFNPSDIGEVSVDTQFINVDDVLDGLDEPAKKPKPPKTPSREEKETEALDIKPIAKKHAEEQKTLFADDAASDYAFPDIALLNPGVHKGKDRKNDVIKKAGQIEETLNNFGVDAKIVGVDVGPSITRFELQPAPGVKVGKIVNLSDDLALNLATSDIRMEAPIPGKSAVGIEVPNQVSDIVSLRDIIDSPAFAKTKSVLPFALGKTLSGQNIIGDISKMPHVLIAGATGSGKSVCINTIIISLLYKCAPDELRFIMVDPKMVELNQYNAIPHMLIPVVTDPKKAAYALNWGIKEMTDRYQLFKDSGVRDIEGYNAKMVAQHQKKLPRIVIVIDELADLMMTSPKEIENAICRIAQLARACGIHLVIATQRPSVDVITGLIKANIPSRIAFSVASNTDSRTILDQVGAEKLLGKGDMLYFPVGKSKPLRVQGTFVSDAEIGRVIDAVSGGKEPVFDNQIEETIENYQPTEEADETEDDLFPQAAELAFANGSISTSFIQRKLRVGYSRAGRIIDELESKGIISGPNGSKPRKCLMTKEEFYGKT